MAIILGVARETAPGEKRVALTPETCRKFVAAGATVRVDRGLGEHAYFSDEAYAAARRIAEGAPLVARWHKKFAKRLADPRPLSEAELDEGYACFGTEDFRIGYRAFLAKQKPQFKGK